MSPFRNPTARGPRLPIDEANFIQRPFKPRGSRRGKFGKLFSTPSILRPKKTMSRPAAAAIAPFAVAEKLNAAPAAPAMPPIRVYERTRPELYRSPGNSRSNLPSPSAAGYGLALMLWDRAMPPHIATQWMEVSNPITRSMA